MVISRITSSMQYQSSATNMQAQKLALAALQEKATTLKNIAKPSDDIAGTAQALSTRNSIAQNDQHARNIQDGTSWLSMVDSSLGNSSEILRRVRDLVVQGANDGTMSATSREAIAIELEGLRDDLMNQANTSVNGRLVFAGTSNQGAAFSRTVDAVTGSATYPYSGTIVDGGAAPVLRRVSETQTIRVDGDGAAAFQSLSTDSVTGASQTTTTFGMIDSIVAELRAGTMQNTRIADVDSALNSISAQRGVVGARYAQMERAEAMNVDTQVTLETRRSGIEDADLAQVVIDLKSQEVSYQAALQVTASSLQTNLLSFLS